MNIYHYYKEQFFVSRKWIWFTVLLFVAAAILGFVIFSFDPQLIQQIFNYFQQLLNQNSSGSNVNLVWIIFQNNISTALYALFGGIILGLMPLGIVLVNGFIMGFVLHFLFRALPYSFGTKLIIAVVTLLPHGIFELPIVLLSASFGLQWGIRWLLPSSKGSRTKIWKADAKTVLVFIPLLVIVLALAAVIEVFVSGKLAALYAARLHS